MSQEDLRVLFAFLSEYFDIVQGYQLVLITTMAKVKTEYEIECEHFLNVLGMERKNHKWIDTEGFFKTSTTSNAAILVKNMGLTELVIEYRDGSLPWAN